MKEKKVSVVHSEHDRKLGMSDALKVAVAMLGVGITAGTVLVVGMNQLMKRIFVSDAWPEEEWSNNDWAEEELE